MSCEDYLVRQGDKNVSKQPVIYIKRHKNAFVTKAIGVSI
jgi:hypothetical protein